MTDAPPLLAYTIWHWPRRGVDREVYESHHRRFHEVLAQDPAPGFQTSVCTRVSSLPWANDGKKVYQDRFLVDSWSVFDAFEPHVISGNRQEPHRRLASTVGGAVAGMYGLRLGIYQVAPRWFYWFAKPSDMTYDEMEASLRPMLNGSVALWGRRLVLGPTPEFCVESQEPVDLPGIDQPLIVRLDSVRHELDAYDRQRAVESRIIT